jgi:spore coat polysaccharide biosynthesis predicted glycosyltransferase SpsG
MATLIFRCDANPKTGLGHFARCRDLAQLLGLERPELGVVFAGDFSAFARGVARELGFSIFEMAPGEALVPPRLSQAAGSDARLLVDSYRLDAAGLGALSAWPAAWAVYDDFAQFDYADCPLVVNTRVSATPARYRSRQVALGPSYFPASPELAAIRGERARLPPKGALERVLIFIGGSDMFGVGPQLAQAITATFAEARVVVVQVEPLDAPEPRVEWQPLRFELAPLLAQADLVIAGGGRSKYEASYCLLPCASVSQTAEQAVDTAELAERGLCCDLGMAQDFDAGRMGARLVDFWRAETLTALRAAQADQLPADSGARLARIVIAALDLG